MNLHFLEAKPDIYDAIHCPPMKWLLILLKVLSFCLFPPQAGSFCGSCCRESYLWKAEDLIFEQYIIPEGYADLLSWFPDAPLWHFVHVHETSDTTGVCLHTIEVSNKTSVSCKEAGSRSRWTALLIQQFCSLLLKDHALCPICTQNFFLSSCINPFTEKLVMYLCELMCYIPGTVGRFYTHSQNFQIFHWWIPISKESKIVTWRQVGMRRMLRSTVILKKEEYDG